MADQKTTGRDLEHVAWLRGFAAALAAVKRLHDQSVIVRSVMDGDGVTVDDLRGDSDLPHPCDDPKLWSARMQEAWDVAHEVVERERVKDGLLESQTGAHPSEPQGARR